MSAIAPECTCVGYRQADCPKHGTPPPPVVPDGCKRVAPCIKPAAHDGRCIFDTDCEHCIVAASPPAVPAGDDAPPPNETRADAKLRKKWQRIAEERLLALRAAEKRAETAERERDAWLDQYHASDAGARHLNNVLTDMQADRDALVAKLKREGRKLQNTYDAAGFPRRAEGEAIEAVADQVATLGTGDAPAAEHEPLCSSLTTSQPCDCIHASRFAAGQPAEPGVPSNQLVDVLLMRQALRELAPAPTVPASVLAALARELEGEARARLNLGKYDAYRDAARRIRAVLPGKVKP